MTLSVWLGEFQLHDDGAVHYIVQQNLSMEKSCQPTTWSCLLTRDSPLLMSKALVITYTVFGRGPCHLCAGLPVYPVLIMGDCSFQVFGPCHLCTGLPVYHVLTTGDYTVLGRWAMPFLYWTARLLLFQTVGPCSPLCVGLIQCAECKIQARGPSLCYYFRVVAYFSSC